MSSGFNIPVMEDVFTNPAFVEAVLLYGFCSMASG
jgi:hypothetical protein